MRRAAARSQCANNLKQIGLAVHGYRDSFNYFPPGTVPDTDLLPDQRLSWFVVVMPYVEANDLYKRIDPKQPWDGPRNVEAGRNYSARLFLCPDWNRERWTPPGVAEWDRGHMAPTTYVGIAGLGVDAALLPIESRQAGVFGYDRRLKMEQIKDGTTNTGMICETGRDVGPWVRGGPGTVRGVEPNDLPLTGDTRLFGGTHFSDSTVLRRKAPTGSHVVLADGSYRFLRDTADPAILAALATVAGGEPVPTDW